MVKPTEKQKKANALERTLVSVKRDLALVSQQFKDLDVKIAERRKELAALDVQLDQKRSTVAAFSDSTADIFNKNVSSIKDAVSQRKHITKSINELEKARSFVEAEIAERRKETIKVPSITFVNQALSQVKKQFDNLTKETIATEDKKNALLREIANLEYARGKLKDDSTANQQIVVALQTQASAITRERDANLKELAREETKTKALRAKERDIRVMHKRLTDEYKKVYNSKRRRSTM